jgi:hypothetical protein
MRREGKWGRGGDRGREDGVNGTVSQEPSGGLGDGGVAYSNGGGKARDTVTGLVE